MKNKWLIALMVVFALLFAVSASMLIAYFAESAQQAQIYKDLAELMDESPETTTEETDDSFVTVLAPDGSSLQILPEFQSLYEENPDIAGWMSIADTKLNYPVMYKPHSKDFYLQKNFYGQKASHGCLYIQESCRMFPASDHLVVFGHNMRDGSMFACLMKYLKKDFYDTHPTITFNTLTERAEYEIFAVFTTATSIGDPYPFYDYISLPNENSFRELVTPAIAKSRYDTGVQPQFGDKILSLVTCEYSQENGRLVVMARKIS